MRLLVWARSYEWPVPAPGYPLVSDLHSPRSRIAPDPHGRTVRQLQRMAGVVKKQTYAIGSDSFEAWHRYLAGLTHDTLDEAHDASKERYEHDTCEPTCRYDIYEVRVEIENVDDGYGL